MDGNISLKFNMTYLRVNSTQDEYTFNVNISSDSNSQFGSHNGSILLTRNKPFDRNWTIPVNITITTNFGDVSFDEPTPITIIACPGNVGHTADVTNNGNAQLTNCKAYLYNDSGDLGVLYTGTAFTLAAGATDKAEISYYYSGSEIEDTFFNVQCDGDRTDNDIRVTFSPGSKCGSSSPSGGQSPSQEEPVLTTPPPINITSVCGNKVCESDETPSSCFEDCYPKIFEIDQIFCTPLLNCGNWKKGWFLNAVVIGILGGLGFFYYRSRKFKRLI